MTYVMTDPQSLWWASYILAQLWYFCKKISLYMAWFFETPHALTDTQTLTKNPRWTTQNPKGDDDDAKGSCLKLPPSKRSKKESTKGWWWWPLEEAFLFCKLMWVAFHWIPMLWNSFAICRVARSGGKQWETKKVVLCRERIRNLSTWVLGHPFC